MVSLGEEYNSCNFPLSLKLYSLHHENKLLLFLSLSLLSALKFWWENENWSWRQETWLKLSHSTRTCWNTLGLDTFSL